MRRLSWLFTVGSFSYPKFLFKFPVAVIAANLILLYEETPSLIVIFTTPFYYIALVPSVCIAYLLISLVFWITRLLDYNFPWNKNHEVRMRLQIIAGVLMPVIPAFIMATIYFSFFGINIFQTVYFSRYLQQIIFMLFVLNAFVLYYWHRKNRERTIPRSLLIAENGNIDPEEIALIFIEDKHYFTYNFQGEKTIWMYSLSKSWAYLPRPKFATINRSAIVNRAAIADINIIAGKITVILTPPLTVNLMVSQRESVAFKKWWLNALARN